MNLHEQVCHKAGESLITILARGQRVAAFSFDGEWYRWELTKYGGPCRTSGACDTVGGLGPELLRTSDRLESQWIEHTSGLSVANSTLTEVL